MKKKFDIENLDIYIYNIFKFHPVKSYLLLLFLMILAVTPFMVEFFFDERLLTQADVYDTSRPLFLLHLFTDLAIGVSYFAITSMLVYFAYKAGRSLPFLWAFVAFGAFIVACGVTHFMEAFVMWQPIYWIAGGTKWITAVISVGTALAIPPLIPRALELVNIAKDAEERRVGLEKANIKLESLNKTLKKQAMLLKKQKDELEKKGADLEALNEHMIGRELRIAELKKQKKEKE